jgi:filamentous hemagglutinin family protein
MNHLYRLVWNNVNACWQAVAETARGQGKTNAKTKASKLASGGQAAVKLNVEPFAKPITLKPIAFSVLLAFSAQLFSGIALAEPTGGQVTAGAGTINQAGAVTTINQATQNMAIDWHSFNVRANEAVNFNQPNANAIALNRVTGLESSSIMGSLTANGKVFILNPNGVLFGNGAQVNVGGLVASTASLSNANFMAGNFNFTNNHFANSNAANAGSIVNNANIHIANGGTLAFIAPVIKNNGTIILNQSVANQGSVILAAADDVTLSLQNGGLTSYTLNKGSVQTLIDNGGLIQADGGYVVLTAKGLDALSQSAINHTGIIEAQTVNSINGKIELLGDMQIGTLNVSGKLDASAPASKNATGGDGGFVETSAAKVNIADNTFVSTKSDNGKTGTWLIDPTNFTIASFNGDMTGAQLSASLANNNVTIKSTDGSQEGQGDINIYDVVNWNSDTTLELQSLRNVNVTRDITLSGNNAGLTLVLGYSDYAPYYYGGGSYYSTGNLLLSSNAKINMSGSNPTFRMGSQFYSNGSPLDLMKQYVVINKLGNESDLNTNTLQGLNQQTSNYFVLGSDIDASATQNWNGGAGFKPATPTTYLHCYYGCYIPRTIPITFNGLGHSVTNLTVNRPNEDNVGLFGLLNSGSITNFALTGNIIGGNSTGGLVGLAGFTSGCVSYCSANELGRVEISNVNATLTVNGIDNVGGLVGSGYANFTQVAADSGVTGRNSVGGLVGDLGFGNIINTYSTGSISGNSKVGGLIGNSYYSQIKNSYSTSLVTGTNDAGGLIGYKNETPYEVVSNSYWDTQKSGQLTSAGGTGKSSAELQQQTTFTDWDFNNVWTIADGSTTPFFGAQTNNVQIGGQNFTLIHNVYELQAMRQDNYGQYALANDIDASVTQGWNNGAGFEPVGGPGGGYLSTNNFIGDFDGLNHKVDSLYINRPDQTWVGLFGVVSNITGGGYFRDTFIKNVSIKNANITGFDGVGIMAGSSSTRVENVHTSGNLNSLSNTGYESGTGGLIGTGGGFIKNVSSQANISGSHNVGGLIGRSYGVDISNSYAETNINATGNQVGGLIGHTDGAAISKSYSFSNITGGENVGGIVGFGKVVLSNSYSSGMVFGNNNVGGVVGGLPSTNSSIQNVYSNANVVSAGTSGGLVGSIYDFSAGVIDNSYWNTQAYASLSNVGKFFDFDSTLIVYWCTGCGGGYQIRSIGYVENLSTSAKVALGGTGKTTSEMQSIDTFKNAGWDISDQAGSNSIWRISAGDYPRLRALTQGTIVIDPTKTNIGVTAPSVTKVYDGVAVTKVSDGLTNDNIANDLASLTGWGNGYTATMNGTPLTDNALFSGTLSYNGANSNWQGAKNAGQYIIDPTGLTAFDPQKYEIRFVAGDLTITPRPLIVQALNTFRAEGAANPTSVSVLTSGLVEGENISKVNVSIEPSALPTAQVGSEHDISPTSTEFSNGLASNYNITYKPGTLAITPADFKGKDWWKKGITEAEKRQLRDYQIQLNGVTNEIMLAAAVYDFTLPPPEGYVLIDHEDSSPTGFASAIYQNITSQKYVIAFRGTEKTSIVDWITDIEHVKKVPLQYDEGLSYTIKAIQKYGIDNLSMVGHSLGGGIAMYASANTGVSATTFNPAKLWPSTIISSGFQNLFTNNPVGPVKNFVFDNEAVQYLGSDYFGYYGGFEKINLYSEGLIGDHFLQHVSNVKATIDQILAENSPPKNGESIDVCNNPAICGQGKLLTGNLIPVSNLNLPGLIGIYDPSHNYTETELGQYDNKQLGNLISDMNLNNDNLPTLSAGRKQYYLDIQTQNDILEQTEINNANHFFGSFRNSTTLLLQVTSATTDFIGATTLPSNVSGKWGKLISTLTSDGTSRVLDSVSSVLTAEEADIWRNMIFGDVQISGAVNKDLLKFAEIVVKLAVEANDKGSLTDEQALGITSGVFGLASLVMPTGLAKAGTQYIASFSDALSAGIGYAAKTDLAVRNEISLIEAKYNLSRDILEKRKLIEIIQTKQTALASN